ncbi:hypothetical protein HUU40_30060 [candidate division KSB1 bacterium]|nr:hypothetical protein [candidate division KSB1 bacterium]
MTVLIPLPILHSDGPTDTVELLRAMNQLVHERGSGHFSLLTKGHAPSLARTHREVLEIIPGLGPALARSLLSRFGSLQGVIAAGHDELMAVAGIGTARAGQVPEILRSEYRAAKR